MKQIFTSIQKEANKILLITILAGTMAACDSVLNYDDGDCSIEYCVKFTYDYNMDGKDYFARDVKTVTLYAFDDNGNLAYQKVEEGEILADGSYAMKLDIDDQQYHLIAWAGLDDQSFAYPLLTPGVSKLSDLTVKTLRRAATRAEGEEGMYVVENALSPLWHGEIKKSTFTRSNGRERYTTVPLVKNTNTIHVNVVQNTGTRAISKNTLNYAIYDDNGYMNYDNTLLEDNLLTYLPYEIEEGNITTNSYPTANPGVTADLSVARLLTTQTPKLSIKNSITGEEFLAKGDMIYYIKQVWEEHYKDQMDFQEYLDREDEFYLTFFVDETLTLLTTVIEINGWIVRLNKIEF